MRWIRRRCGNFMFSWTLQGSALIGTVAFAISGSMVAVEQQMDIFGIMILALTTATGGGFIRDLTIGNIPPAVFRNPVYIVLSFATAGIVFLILKFGTHRPGVDSKLIHFYERLLLISDSLGLAAFTVDGVYAGHTMPDTNLFLSVFLGVITGVGGGVLRDLFAGKKGAVDDGGIRTDHPYPVSCGALPLESPAGAVRAVNYSDV